MAVHLSIKKQINYFCKFFLERNSTFCMVSVLVAIKINVNGFGNFGNFVK